MAQVSQTSSDIIKMFMYLRTCWKDPFVFCGDIQHKAAALSLQLVCAVAYTCKCTWVSDK